MIGGSALVTTILGIFDYIQTGYIFFAIKNWKNMGKSQSPLCLSEETTLRLELSDSPFPYRSQKLIEKRQSARNCESLPGKITMHFEKLLKCSRTIDSRILQQNEIKKERNLES